MSYGYKTNLKLDGKIIDVDVVSYDFDRSINPTGRSTSPLEGGLIYLSLSDMPKNSVLQWGLKHRSYKKGIIELIGAESGSSIVPEEVEFKDAACINMKLIYERDSANYFTTLLTISPRSIRIGRKDTWINKKWTIEEPLEKAVPNENDALDLFRPHDAAMEAILTVNDLAYEVMRFETEFIQPEDFKGQPQQEVKGGLLMVTLQRVADDNLNKLAYEDGLTFGGNITFRPISKTESAPLILTFKEAKCIHINKMFGSKIGYQVTLLFAAEEIDINAIRHSNVFTFIN